MTTTVFRSRHAQYQCGSTSKGEALAKFFDGKLETDDTALAEQLTKQPGFSKTPGAGDFWIDGPATAQANSVPAIKAPETTKEPDATNADPNAQQTAANSAGGAGGEGDNNGDQGTSSPETVPPANPDNANSDGTGGKKNGGGGKGAKASK